ncbi:hypothetical protein J6590_079571 [Homalodisca vitripennis]|nr:hypothetical protein J6590_079571 [Homalodisca vitripennis]
MKPVRCCARRLEEYANLEHAHAHACRHLLDTIRQSYFQRPPASRPGAGLSMPLSTVITILPLLSFSRGSLVLKAPLTRHGDVATAFTINQPYSPHEPSVVGLDTFLMSGQAGEGWTTCALGAHLLLQLITVTGHQAVEVELHLTMEGS